MFVVGISPRIADPDVLKKNEFFGKFGKIHKVVVNPCLQVGGRNYLKFHYLNNHVTTKFNLHRAQQPPPT